MVACFRCLLVNEQPLLRAGRGVSTWFSFSRRGANPIKRRVNLRKSPGRKSRDRSFCRPFGISQSRARRVSPSRDSHRAIRNQGRPDQDFTSRIVSRVSNFRRGFVLDPKVHTSTVRARARTHVAPATGMRKLSYSTSPRLTAPVLRAPVDKHDRNNSGWEKKKKLSLTPDRVSA